MMAVVVAGGLLSVIPLQAQDAPKTAGGDQAAPAAPAMRRPAISVDMLAKQLDLTDDQKTKVKPILDEMQTKRNELGKDTTISQTDRRAKMKEIRDAAGVKLKEVLTPEQYAKWEKLGQGGRRPAPPAAPAAPATDTAPKN